MAKKRPAPSMAALPIDPRLPEIVEALRAARGLVLVAEPGAGKTTRTPRALLDACESGSPPFSGELLVVEPRRLAARTAARRVASELSEEPGRRIGYQVRFEEVASAETKVRFITEGILLRRLATDPLLRGVGAVLFDEFHERHLAADLALALLRALRREERPDLALGVMSATIDAAPIASFLGCPALEVAGRTHPVHIEHAEAPDRRPLHDQVRAALQSSIARGLDGDVLVFLPGAGEIRRAREACEAIATREDLAVVVLHGDLPAKEQDRALAPLARRKVILSTNVAETSVTIEGVTVVIDSGLARAASHSPWSGLPTLETRPISQASATQRAGRAGRLGPGRCIRLYTRHDHDGRRTHDVAEIHRADLCELVLLLRARGFDPSTFAYYEGPPPAALAAAESLLDRLGAIRSSAGSNRLSTTGEALLALPIHPRLGRVVLEGEARGVGEDACLVAALLAEREIRLRARTRLDENAGIDTVGRSDALERLEAFLDAERDGLDARALRRYELDGMAVAAVDRARRQLVRALERLRRAQGLPEEGIEDASAHGWEDALLISVLAGFPDRVGRRRASSDDLVFSGGGSGTLAPTSVVKEAAFAVALEVDERRRGGTLVRLASAVEPEWLLELFPDRVEDAEEMSLDETRGRVVVCRALRYDGLVLDESRRDANAHDDDAAATLLAAAEQRGLISFVDADALARFERRVAFAAAHGVAVAPIDDAARAAALAAASVGCASFKDIRSADPLRHLEASIGPARADIDRVAPRSVSIPGHPDGVPIHYEPDRPPWIASRIQDFFGLTDGPRVARGAVPLVLHLTAPNDRPVQVTSDLAGFWERHYPTLRKELSRRYPRHSFPDDPRTAPARRIKPR